MTMPQPASAPVPLEQTRERVVLQLCEHFAADNLTPEALEDRLDAAHRAATVDELRALVADLPVVAAASGPAPAVYARPVAALDTEEEQTVMALLSEVQRRGVWTPARQVNANSVMGTLILDLREARLGDVTRITASAVLGAVQILVPPGVQVEVDGSAVLGSFILRGSAPAAGPGAPVVRIGGMALLGSVEVFVRHPGESAGDARRRARLERREQRRLNR